MKISLQHLYPFFIFCFGLFIFTVGLSHQEIIEFDSRFFLFAKEMCRHGVTWFPQTYEKPYPDYPGTTTFLIFLAAKIFGGLNKFTAVLPSAIAASLTLVFTFWIGALERVRIGFYAVLFLLLTQVFLETARIISPDQFVTLITTVCFYIVLAEKKLQKPNQLRWILLLLASGFFVRGPLGFVIPAGVVSSFYLCDKNFKKFFMFGCASGLVLMICAAVWLALAYHVGGISFLKDVIHMEVAGRMNDPHMPSRFIYFTHGLGSFALVFPLSLLILCSFKKEIRTPFVFYCAAWATIILVGMNIPSDKQMRYILPMAPALALICGYWFDLKLMKGYLFYLKKIFIFICYFLPLFVALIFFFLKQNFLAETKIDGFILWMLCLQLLIFLQKKIFSVDTPSLVSAVIVFFSIHILIVEPIHQKINLTQHFVLETEKYRTIHHANLVFYKEGADGLPIKYLANMEKEDRISFLNNPNDINQIKNSVMIMRTENFLTLPHQVMQHWHCLSKGKIGHAEVVVLAQTTSPCFFK